MTPLPVPTSAARFGPFPIHSSARWTSISVAGRGVKTRPGSVANGSPANVVSEDRVFTEAPLAVPTSGRAGLARETV
jgi:hypothetical protein